MIPHDMYLFLLHEFDEELPTINESCSLEEYLSTLTRHITKEEYFRIFYWFKQHPEYGSHLSYLLTRAEGEYSLNYKSALKEVFSL